MADARALVVQVATGGTVPLGGGLKVVTGGALINVYNYGGCTLNLANYFATSGYPLVICSSANGMAFHHDGGTAAAGRVRAYYQVMQIATQANEAFNAALGEVGDANVLAPSTGTINIPFVAIGKPF